ncbi:NAD(P)-dependent dehydrogenase, short-chain alcohol dehydrogenase family [Kaistia soli DSM 19436]|uniref:NAD(P)-dependent dehydrogenase, short-chain alcohol dehydrogenase family n=1 Tax=Kaistia soli DSM 19436 TaxID=1122133 RepID=A0A1M5E840_9HYPH|nr:D-threitol dehydrogenase [Kaistia soli]SHF75423.1 NAD(P)-dependent dehydrogenase, short-chain alcohol dehydrogenase family [Kaistia soli DSM 19436]
MTEESGAPAGALLPFDLHGKVAIVTGAAGGIGSALCHRFAEAGARIALFDRNPAVIAAAEALGTAHQGFVGDVTDEASIISQVEAVAAAFGQIDILVNNAGIGTLHPAEVKPTADFDLTIAVNLRAPFLYAREAARHMLARGYGRVVTIASQAAVIGIEGHVAYSASKAGLIGMTNCMALEWGPRGVTANCISPTVVETEMAKIGWAGEKGVRARAEIPTRRFAQPDEIALAALYLASDAAAMVNGANLMVDGGYTIR